MASSSSASSAAAAAQVVTPGEPVAPVASDFLRGHGTYTEGGALFAGVAGALERVNKLLTVRPLRSRYGGAVGDVVVGRVREVGSKRWRVDVGSRTDAALMLSSVNLEGGEQRRRTAEDQMAMRSVYEEGDLLSAEVHSVLGDGTLSLHARSAKYGRLGNGVLVVVPCALVRRLRQHFVSLPGTGVDAIFGLNGWVWLTETLPRGHADGDGAAAADQEAEEAAATAGLIVDGSEAPAADSVEAVEAKRRLAAERIISPAGRERIAAVHNALALLSGASLSISPEAVLAVLGRAAAAGLPAKAMLLPEHATTLLGLQEQ